MTCAYCGNPLAETSARRDVGGPRAGCVPHEALTTGPDPLYLSLLFNLLSHSTVGR